MQNSAYLVNKSSIYLRPNHVWAPSMTVRQTPHKLSPDELVFSPWPTLPAAYNLLFWKLPVMPHLLTPKITSDPALDSSKHLTLSVYPRLSLRYFLALNGTFCRYSSWLTTSAFFFIFKAASLLHPYPSYSADELRIEHLDFLPLCDVSYSVAPNASQKSRVLTNIPPYCTAPICNYLPDPMVHPLLPLSFPSSSLPFPFSLSFYLSRGGLM